MDLVWSNEPSNCRVSVVGSERWTRNKPLGGAGSGGKHIERRTTNEDITMSRILNDLAAEIESYPTTDVTISVVDIAPHPPSTPGGVNVNERWRFKVRVANNGNLNMTGVSLHVQGNNGALVSASPAGPFTSLITAGSFTVNGGGSQDSATLYFQAPSVAKPAGTQLVNAHIADFSANFEHFFTNHTPHSITPEGVYTTQVFP
jgi:hypothetical protein